MLRTYKWTRAMTLDTAEFHEKSRQHICAENHVTREGLDVYKFAIVNAKL